MSDLNLKCDFCENESVGVYTYGFGPVSLSYCQKCLDTNSLRTIHQVIMNWAHYGHKIIDESVVCFRGQYIKSDEFIDNLTEEMINEMYGDPRVESFRTIFLNKLKSQ